MSNSPLDPLTMHFFIEGKARFSVGLRKDGTVEIIWRRRDAVIYEALCQKVQYIDGQWIKLEEVPEAARPAPLPREAPPNGTGGSVPEGR